MEKIIKQDFDISFSTQKNGNGSITIRADVFPRWSFLMKFHEAGVSHGVMTCLMRKSGAADATIAEANSPENAFEASCKRSLIQGALEHLVRTHMEIFSAFRSESPWLNSLGQAVDIAADIAKNM